jgi:fructan beta-fructosidase
VKLLTTPIDGPTPHQRSLKRAALIIVALTIGCVLVPVVSDQSASAGTAPNYPEFPYASTDHSEPFRGQFHFSPPNGWMNDINGPIYYRGVYHLFFQSNPHSLGSNNDIHWGQATSTDLVHWTQQPIALEPGVQAPGGPQSLLWSGSAWVDTANVTGLKSGSDDPILLFTGTDGVSIAYSTDGAKTFQMYNGGAQVVSTGTTQSRDPKIQWNPVGNRWVMVLYDFTDAQGASFYTSTNLLSWTKVGHYPASWFVEVPDLYELPVDGNTSNEKWVLQDAGGQYLIGHLDSSSMFVPDSTTPLSMESGNTSYGGTWYASQTFNQLPSARVVQMGWQGGNQGATWTGNASFPVQLGLSTFSDGVRLTRNPVSEISNLRASTQTWGSRSITTDPSSDPLTTTTADTYELQATFSTSGATATSVSFALHRRSDGSSDASVSYNLATQQLVVDNTSSTTHPTFSTSMPPISGSVSIHVLVDRGQLEVYGNGGRTVISDNVNFNSATSSQGLSLTATGGSVTMSGLSFSSLLSAWRVSPEGVSPGNAIVSALSQVAKSLPTDPGTMKCVDNDGPTGKVQIWDCTGGANQFWLLEADASLRVNGLCMQIPAGQTANHTLVQTATCSGATNQLWSRGNFGSVVNQLSGRCLDVDSGNYTNGQQLQIYDCVGSPNQAWVGPTPASPPSGAIVWDDLSKCLDRDVASGHAQIWDCLGNSNQTWTMNSNGTITTGGLCLELPSGQTANNTLVDVATCTGASNQVWARVANQSLRNSAAGRCLDLASGDPTNGRQLQVYDCVGGANQYWISPS